MSDDPKFFNLKLPSKLSKKDLVNTTNQVARYIDFLTGEMQPDYEALTKLTKREREIMIHLALGLTCSEIGDELKLSRRTVENHKYNLLKKLGTQRVTDLTRIAMREGLIPP